MEFRKIASGLIITGISFSLGLVSVESNFAMSNTAFAATKTISLKEGKKLLKKAGFGSELSYAKLKSKSRAKTIIYTYPGAQGMDKFSLHPYGKKRVKIYASFGSTSTGHFTKINYLHYPKYKVVKR